MYQRFHCQDRFTVANEEVSKVGCDAGEHRQIRPIAGVTGRTVEGTKLLLKSGHVPMIPLSKLFHRGQRRGVQSRLRRWRTPADSSHRWCDRTNRGGDQIAAAVGSCTNDSTVQIVSPWPTKRCPKSAATLANTGRFV